MKRRLLNLEKFTYTVNYNAEGATVFADGEQVGIISGGTLIFNKYGNDAKDSYSITFTGGTMTKPDDFYTFSVNPTTLSFESGGGSQSVNVTSTLTTYSNSHSSGTVNRDGSVTLQYNTTNQVTNVEYTSSASGTGLSVNGTNISFTANPNYSTRSGSVTFTQDTSNYTATVTCNQAALSLYNYTVYSNCSGGTVYFNNVNKGTISGGSLSFTDEASSGTVRISGGVPSNNTVNGSSTTEYGYSSRSYTDTDSTTEYNCSISTSSLSFAAAGGTSSITYTNQSRTGTRSRTVTQPTRRSRTATPYTTYTYTAPSNQTCQGNNSVTMNYSSSTSTGTSYGSWSSYSDYGSASYGNWSSWSYGSWSSSNASVSESLSWITTSTSSSSVSVTASANSSTSSRSGTIRITLKDGSHTVSVSQSYITYVFSVSGSFEEHQASASSSFTTATAHAGYVPVVSYSYDGTTYTRVPFDCTYTNIVNGVYTTNNGSGSSTGYAVAIGMTEYSILSKGTSYNRRNETVTLTQQGSGKTLQLSITQRSYRLYIFTNQNGYKGTGEDQSYNIVYNTVNGGYTWYAQSDDGFDNINAYITNSNSAWYLNNITDGGTSRTSITLSSGGAFQINADTNTSTSSRSTTATVYINGKTNLGNIKINITQAGQEYYFTLNYSGPTMNRAIVSTVSTLSTGNFTPSGAFTFTSGGSYRVDSSSCQDGSRNLIAPFTSTTQTRTFYIYEINTSDNRTLAYRGSISAECFGTATFNYSGSTFT